MTQYIGMNSKNKSWNETVRYSYLNSELLFIEKQGPKEEAKNVCIKSVQVKGARCSKKL